MSIRSLLRGCAAPALLAVAPFASHPAFAQTPADNPAVEEVSLPALAGWKAQLVLDNGTTGIWAVRQYPIFDTYGVPELVGLDDYGRCNIMVSYSGKWTPRRTIEEGKWLGAMWHGDLDPRAPGSELYVGGATGNLYQVRAYPYAVTDHRLIAQFPGMEIHTVIGGEVDARTAGPELFVFTRPGALYRVRPTGPDGTFESEKLTDLPGRVRDAVLVPAEAGLPSGAMLTTSRAGDLSLVYCDAGGVHVEACLKETVGLGRLALGLATGSDSLVCYVGADDGRVLRLEHMGHNSWRRETVFRGPQGVRGVATGRFDADPAVETVAVFGYSGRVQLLRRVGEMWQAETIFEDRDKGHWLARCEVDARNGTDELVASGYGGRIVILRRPPGYACADGAALDPEMQSTTAAPVSAGPRIGVMAGPEAAKALDPLSYSGGFEPKTLVYETLVQRDETGALQPGLARAWQAHEGGRVWTFELRPGATWSDGSPVLAEQVAWHFRRCSGVPEHAWLRGLARVREVQATGERSLRFVLSEPWYLPGDLCAINPCAVRGPGALDGEGRFVAPSGSGAYAWRGPAEAGRVLRFEGRAGGGPVQLVRLDGAGDSTREVIDTARLDALADGWEDAIVRSEFEALRHRSGWQGKVFPGSSVWYLSFSLSGPSAQAPLRRALAAAIDRDALVRSAEAGFAQACSTWMPPQCAFWPAARPVPASAESSVPHPARLVLLAERGARAERIGRVLVEQWRAAGWNVELEVAEGPMYHQRLEDGAYDLRIEKTWGLPYDPDISMQARFLPELGHQSAARSRDYGVLPRLRELTLAAAVASDEESRRGVFAQFQRCIEESAAIVPLLVPDRLALWQPDRLTWALGADLYRWPQLKPKETGQ
ncbi:MAG: ABC transporter substrate-binding protein [Planctomycetota bacterium]